MDVDPVTFALDAGAVERVLTARTVAVLTAHLFGARNDTAALARVTKARGLLLIEDCAQCFDGRPRARGKADVELYSFGSIKTATCLGGAVALIGDATLRAAIEERGAQQPVQFARSFALKVLKYVLLVGISGPRAFWLFSRVARDYDALLRRLTRGYDEAELLPRLRQRPSRALLALLAYRLKTYDPARVQARRVAGERVAAKTPALGGGGALHTHWLFPVVSQDVAGLVARLRAAGFDATNGASTLVAIDASAAHATEVMAQVVYLPVYDEMPTEALDELGRLVEAHGRRGS
jgi:dTDP-4-amino-4,6-dideoxygalactose transaminase